MAAKTVTARAYASTGNLGHGMDFLGLALDIAFDEITAEITETTDQGDGCGDIEILGDPMHPDIPTHPRKNTAGRAVMALLEAQESRVGLRLRLRKGTRPGSGLGSSAASAAAAVVAVNELLGFGLSRGALVPFASAGEAAAAGAAHADNVAPALLGGFVIVDGHDAMALEIAGQPRFVVALPEVRVSTKDAREALPVSISMSEYSHGAARAALTVSAWQRGDMKAFGGAIEDSLIDACRARLIPGYERVAAAARNAGAVGVAISGAGPAVLAVLDDVTVGARVCGAMRAGFEAAGLACETYEAGVGPAAEVVG